MPNFKKIFALFTLLATSILIFSCTPSRVIRQTENTAIIQGVGATKVEARINAEDAAKKIFPNYKLTKEPDYSQEYNTQVKGDAETGDVEGHGSTYWSCILEIEKQ